ncbi:MAG: type II CAAX endopeptidase family protein [Candidatus Saccharimonadales bacterium]
MLNDSSKQAAKDAAVLPTAELEPASVSTEKPAKKGMWGPIAAVLYTLFIYVATQVVASLVLIIGMKALGWNTSRAEAWLDNSIPAQFAFILLAEALCIAGVFWFVRRRQVLLRTIGWNSVQMRYIGVALVGFGAYFLSYILVAVLASKLVPSLNMEQKQEIGFSGASTPLELMLTFVSLVILPPLAEEILFRGFLFTGMRQKLRFLPAAIITSIIFAVGHLQFGSGAPLLWVAAIDTFVLSMVLCYVRVRSDSLWSAIFIHAMKNGLAFSVLFLVK